jgi:hypothetical protein
MHELCRLIWCGLIGFFRSRASLEAEILVLRHQLNVLRRKSAKRPSFGSIDRLIFAGLYGLAPHVLSALAIVRPETVIRWHRAGFRLYWRWKSKSPGGRPKLPVDIRTVIRDISLANPLWGAPRIHGELLKLGITIGQTTGVCLRRYLFGQRFERIGFVHPLHLSAPIAAMLQPKPETNVLQAWSTGAYDTPSALGLSEINGLSPFILRASR